MSIQDKDIEPGDFVMAFTVGGSGGGPTPRFGVVIRPTTEEEASATGLGEPSWYMFDSGGDGSTSYFVATQVKSLVKPHKVSDDIETLG